jgi:superfamily II DNA or RNA helicase
VELSLKLNLFRVFFYFSLILESYSGFAIEKPKIVLQPHQEKTVNYLMRHQDQKGLLFYHSLGSGKTYAALAYTEKFPEKKVIVFSPRFLKSNWRIQMESFGVKNTSRYELISFEEAENLRNIDLKNTILIIDEIHKLVAMVHHRDQKVAALFSEIYFKIRSADKILALTGTPIFSDASDIAFIANLVSGKDVFPFDRNKFRIEYQTIKPATSLFRGYFMESKLMASVVPFVITLTGVVMLATVSPVAVPLVAIGGAVAIPFANEMMPAGEVSFREFNPEKMKDFTSKYISFYEIKMEEDSNYPTKKINNQRVHYSEPQSHFFLDLADEDLSREELRMLLDEEGKTLSDEYINFHSMDIQRSFLNDPVVGRDIGNFSLKDGKGVFIESPKFDAILKNIRKKPGQVMVYSNYFKNGILKFAEFLDRNGMKNQYLVLHPDLSVEEQIDRIEKYNVGAKRILLIHPEITEGVSLNGTEQVHILEPMTNRALLQQVIGRAVRFKSHLHLPKNRQHVDIYVWESYITYSNYFPIGAGTIRRKHWQKRYSEINPSMWTKGIVEVDKNYFRKEQTADTRIANSQDTLQTDMDNFRELLKIHSIERSEM